MKRRTLVLASIACLAAAIAACLLAVGPMQRLLIAKKNYSEAEPLVQVIWPMSGDLKDFHAKHGRLPRDLDELQAFAPGNDLSRLRGKSYRFNPDGPILFQIQVNENYEFRISRDFIPALKGSGASLGEAFWPK